jgi:Tol biopolymer transport system component
MVMAVVLVGTASSPAGAAPGLPIVRITVTTTGGNAVGGLTQSGSISADGRLVAVSSDASNLVPGDTNGQDDVFIRDLEDYTTTRESVSSTGEQANAWSGFEDLSADGRYLVFMSGASNLVDGDTNQVYDVFRRDLETHTTIRISTDSEGEQLGGQTQPTAMSRNGRFVAMRRWWWDTDGEWRMHVYLKDVEGGSFRQIDVPATGFGPDPDADWTYATAVTDDGTKVVLSSDSSNLVASDTNGEDDLFIRNVTTNTTTRVGHADGRQFSHGTHGGGLSADGRYLAFSTYDASVVPNDDNGQEDVFRRDLTTGATIRITGPTGIKADGTSRGGLISADGRVIVFQTWADNLGGSASSAQDTGDGEGRPYAWVEGRPGFRSISVNTAGEDTLFDAAAWDLSDDGRFVLFRSASSELVPGDTNETTDMFRADLALVPDAPGTPKMKAGFKIGLSWSAPPANGREAPTGYELEVFRGGLDETPDTRFTLPTSARTDVVPGLTAGEPYRFRVAGRNAAGVGAKSGYSEFAVPPFTAIEGDRGALVWLYTWMADRRPTTSEVGTEANRLLKLQGTAQDLTVRLLGSGWMTNDVMPSARLYASFFARSPDAGGLRYWAEKRKAGWTLARVAQEFSRSSEFRTKYGTLSDTDFVKHVYRNVLHRDPDAAGLSYWVGKIRSGTTRGAVMATFSESSEHVRVTKAAVDATAISFGLLGKVPTSADLTRWATKSRAQVVQELYTSISFEQRVAGL